MRLSARLPRLAPRRAFVLAVLGGAAGAILLGAVYWQWTQTRDASSGSGDGVVQPLDPEQVIHGRTVYESFCAQCHGAQGEGGPNWRLQNSDGTYPPPPHDSTGHTWHHGDGFLYRTVRDGGAFNETPGFKSAMPAFGDRLSPQEIPDVIAYLKSLWGTREKEFQAQATLRELFR